MKKVDIFFTINGVKKTVSAHPMKRLLDLLREELELTGTKEGCGEGECGACSVFVEGKLVNSCLIPSLQVQGCEVKTIEGVADGEQLHRVQESFLKEGGAQCGICTPGMIMAAIALLEENSEPSYEEIQEGLAGNLCRCTGYTKIFTSVVKACQK